MKHFHLQQHQTKQKTAAGANKLADKYGMRAFVNEYDVPTCSFPLKIEDAPEGAESFALILENKDDFPSNGGFSWIHWTAANTTKNELVEDEAMHAEDGFRE